MAVVRTGAAGFARSPVTPRGRGQPSAVPVSPRARRVVRHAVRTERPRRSPRAGPRARLTLRIAGRRLSVPRQRPWAAGAILLLTLAWYALNLRRFSPLDLLPIAYTWLVLYLGWTLLADLAARARRELGRRPARAR